MMARPDPARPDIIVRAAVAADLDEVYATERSAFSLPWSRRSFTQIQRSPSSIFLVASTDTRRVAGYAIALLGGDEADLANIAVVDEERGRGVGRALIDRVIALLRGRGVRSLYLEVRQSNSTARALYRRVGFLEVGVRAGYYTHPVEDALVLRLDL
jgi:[ribosomal protein S18]-alanine N-acetyltransferase